MTGLRFADTGLDTFYSNFSHDDLIPKDDFYRQLGDINSWDGLAGKLLALYEQLSWTGTPAVRDRFRRLLKKLSSPAAPAGGDTRQEDAPNFCVQEVAMTPTDDHSMKGKWRSAPPEMVARFNTIVRDMLPGAEMRRMFGYPCVFVNGNMLAGLFDDYMMMRLSPVDRQAFLQLDGAREFSPMPGKTMREYVAVPADMVADDERLAAWLERGRAYTEALPVKPKVGK